MINKIYTVIFIIGAALSLASCNLINPDEPIPAYIQVDEAIVISSEATGSASHNINDIWLYVDNKLVGTYEIPFKVPVLPSGKHKVTLEAGIKQSSISNVRVIYPFYTSFIVDTLLEGAKTYKLTPVYEYEEKIKVPLLEDFESLGNSFEATSSSDTVLMSVQNENCFEGHSGYVALTAERPNFDVKTSEAYALPNTSKIFLELDYACTDTLTVGVFGRQYDAGTVIDVRKPIIILRPTNGQWKKIYISLTDMVFKNPKFFEYSVFFSASTKHDSGDKSAEIYIDNIKLIHY